MTPRLAVFDVDGTLIDSRAIITACMDRAFEAAGLLPPGYERTRRIIGLSLGPGLNYLAPEADEALRAQLLDHYRTAFFDMRHDPAFQSPAYAGAEALLHELAEAGWVLGIATGKSRRGLDALLEQQAWADLFSVSLCADDGPGKPHPHMVLANMDATRIGPEATFVIGDSEHDMAMAVAAGTQGIGVTWGFGTAQELDNAGAAHVLHTMGDLSALFRHGLSSA